MYSLSRARVAARISKTVSRTFVPDSFKPKKDVEGEMQLDKIIQFLFGYYNFRVEA